MHPWWADKVESGWQNQLTEVLKSTRSGVGEIGLDGARDIDKSLQIQLFTDQLDMAKQLCRPASIHCVKMWGKLLEILKQYYPADTGFMVHGYYGSVETAQQLVRLGGYISFNAMGLGQRRKKITTDLIRCVPLDKILVETDSPYGMSDYLSDHKTENNEPANLPKIVEGLADLIGIEPNELADITTTNALEFTKCIIE